jgi:hypothetical protein
VTVDEKIGVLERMRELMSDPDRVVLDPENLYETPEGVSIMGWQAAEIVDTCRACFIGSVHLALSFAPEQEWLGDGIIALTGDKCIDLEFGCHTDALGGEYLQVFRFAGTTAFLGYAFALIHASIWFRRNWGTTARFLFDGLIYALLTAGTFGWLWPR